MRDLNLIVVHCSATNEGEDFDVDDIREMHLARGWRDIGYHFVITRDGQIQAGRPIDEIGAHVRGHNKGSIGVCYIGGLDKNGKPKDTRTPNQKFSLTTIIESLKEVFPTIDKVVGHRDLSPDLNGDGTIQANERIKECPSFSAVDEYNC